MPRGKSPRGEFPRKLDRDCKLRLAELTAEAKKLRAAERELARQRKALDGERKTIDGLRHSLVAD